MARDVTTTVYQYAELSEDAKERARDWFRQGNDDFGFSAETVIEEAAHMADLLGLNIRTRTAQLMGGGTRQEPQVYYSGFHSQGDGASFVGSYSYRKGSVRAMWKEAPAVSKEPRWGNFELNRIARELLDVQRRNFYRITATTTVRGHYSHSGCMHVDVERNDSVAMSDSDIEIVQQLMRDFADWIYVQLEKEYEYQNSDDVVADNIIANEYEFHEDGSRA